MMTHNDHLDEQLINDHATEVLKQIKLDIILTIS